MVEVIEWANGNGWTIKLTGNEAIDLKSELISALEEQGEDTSRQTEEEQKIMETETKQLPYYCFKKTDTKQYLEGRFWNQSGKQLAIIAIVTQIGDWGDWSAYIGTDAPNSYREEDTLIQVAKHGCKLSEEDARHFFPDIKLPYRN